MADYISSTVTDFLLTSIIIIIIIEQFKPQSWELSGADMDEEEEDLQNDADAAAEEEEGGEEEAEEVGGTSVNYRMFKKLKKMYGDIFLMVLQALLSGMIFSFI